MPGRLIVIIIVILYRLWHEVLMGQLAGDPFGIDFSIFYSAALLALAGTPEQAYNVAVHHQVLESVLGQSIHYLLGWFYPPVFLLFVLPFGLLPYKVSLVIWLGLTFIIYVISIRKIFPDPTSLWIALGFPGVLLNVSWGQNGFISTCFLGLGIRYVQDQPALSGLMFALLCYKPQFALLPLLVLLFAREWRVLKYTFLFGSLLASLSLALFGLDMWTEYLNIIPQSGHLALNADWQNVYPIQPTISSFLRLMGMADQTAIAINILTLGALVVITTWTWKNVSSLAMRGMIMTAAVVLGTPYVMQYDLVILALPVLWYMAEAHGTSWLPGEKAIIILLWIIPLINWPLVAFTGIQTLPLLLLMVLALAMRRINCFYKPIPFISKNG